MKNIIFVFSLSVCTGLAFADTVSLWRGETVYVEMKTVEALAVPASTNGISFRAGAFRSVAYATAPKGTAYASTDDCVMWLPHATRVKGAHGVVPFEVTAAADAEPGTYDFAPLGLPLTVKIEDKLFPKPTARKTYLDLWQHPWAVARYFGVKPFSEEHFAKMRPVYAPLAAAGQKVLTTTVVALPWNHQCYDGYGTMVRHIRKADGSWTFDYDVFDRYVDFGRSCGIGPYIACYTLCPWGYVVRWEDETGAEQKAEAKPGTPFFEEYWKPFLVDFTRHLKDKGWLKDTFIAMDERGPEDVKRVVELVRACAPGLRISMAGCIPPSNYKGIEIDAYSQLLDYVTPEFLAEAKARRAEGKITTFYVCCIPAAPNTFLDSPCEEAETLGRKAAETGLDGFLRWAWNSWPTDPYADGTFGPWCSGDTFLVYPDGSPSRRFLHFRNGLNTAEKRLATAGE